MLLSCITALCFSIVACNASPPVEVGLEASFPAGPYLVELLETAASENSSCYFPLLDRIATGHFDDASTDSALYESFVRILQHDGHISAPDQLASFKFALAIRSAAPRVEAHFQYHESTFQHNQTSTDGILSCTTRVDTDCAALPFDHTLGTAQSAEVKILYADITSASFRQHHAELSAGAHRGEYVYLVRYTRATNTARPLAVLGYGVELALKRTDYIVIDDRASEDDAPKSPQQADEQDATNGKDLRPLSTSELAKLDLRAASHIMASKNPFDTLLDISKDFPKHSAALSHANLSQDLLDELKYNRNVLMSSNPNVIWINGMQIAARDFDAYSMLEHLRRERRLVKTATDLGLNNEQAINLFSSPLLAESQGTSEAPQRYDWRDSHEGGNVIMWLNDIEKDSRYLEWPASLRALLQRTYPGQLPSCRKDIHNLILPIDFADHGHVQVVVENVQSFVTRGIPIRFGLVPITSTEAATAQAGVAYHLLETYGISSMLAYMQKSLAAEGARHAAPVAKHFDVAIKDLPLRKDKEVLSLQQISENKPYASKLESATSYLHRLGAIGSSPSFFINGIPFSRDDNWMQTLSAMVGSDLRFVQQAVYEGVLDDDANVADHLLTDALLRRNSAVIPENDSEAKIISLAAVEELAEGFIGLLPSVPAVSETKEVELTHLVVVADFDKAEGGRLFEAAVAFRALHDNIELFFVHNGHRETGSRGFSQKLLELMEGDEIVFEELTSLEWAAATSDGDEEENLDPTPWQSATSLLDLAGLAQGHAGIILNGRVVALGVNGPAMDLEAFETLYTYECKRRLTPAAKVLKSIGLADAIRSPLNFAKLSNVLALSTAAEPSEGIFDGPPRVRSAVYNELKSEHSMFQAGDKASASVHIVAMVDPASEQAQRALPILKVLSELDGVSTRIFLAPREKLQELPIKRFYRHVLQSAPTFEPDGSLVTAKAHFDDLPENALLTIGLDMPPAWLVSPRNSVHDLDNLKLANIKTDSVEATYQLDSILIEGHTKDSGNGQPPRGAQLVLGTVREPHVADTIIMANLGYFQFKANPGYYEISLQKGRSQQVYSIDTLGATGQDKFVSTSIALTSFRGLTLYPKLSRNAGMEDADVLQSSTSNMEHLANKAQDVLAGMGRGGKEAEKWLAKATDLGGALLNKAKSKSKSSDVQTMPHAEINIFSVASGHLYERMLNLMMLSVMKHTNHTVKFWFIEQFLSPSFKAFIPLLAAEYGFRYEMVTYKWPHWLRAQKEKQREIWGYKILFLDVLFPLDLDKVIFVDADQIVRTDMYELVQTDLQGAPYGFTPMCDSRTEMEGFRFWKQGYWRNYLRGLPYHISALYVVDLKKFRQIAAGDRLRGQYHGLSADPASLSNLDQDLPNHMQHSIPIHSLSQEWLWCETWCSDESLGVARTIDLCNNPQTKEPKLDRARRQIPEWTVYDDEVAALAKRHADASGEAAIPIAGSFEDGGEQAQVQAEEAAQHRQEQAEQSTKEEAQQATTREHVIDEL